MPKRCAWAGDNPLMRAYHDHEWGVPEYESQKLFAHLQLEGMQAGLTWQTILNKRETIYAAFSEFNPQKLACYDEQDVKRLLNNPGIIRNRLKVGAVIGNANAYLSFQAQNDWSTWLWSFVGGQPQHNHWHNADEIPTETDASQAMAKALKKAGFRFVGPTICYAFMQAVGMVNDHSEDCFCYCP